MISPDDIVSLLPDFLPRQRWYGAADLELENVTLASFDVLRSEWPVLAWLLADATFGDGSSALFQLPIGLRPLEQTERFLEGKGRSFLGDVDTALRFFPRIIAIREGSIVFDMPSDKVSRNTLDRLYAGNSKPKEAGSNGYAQSKCATA